MPHVRIKYAMKFPLSFMLTKYGMEKQPIGLKMGMNIVQISLWLGHEYLQTTMVYLDISNDKKAAALATLSDETSKKVTPKWKNAGGSLLNLYGLS